MRMIESQYIMLPIIDRLWVDHLYIMDALKAGIGLRGYGQKDPRVEYEKEAYEIFEDLKNNIADEAIKAVFLVRIEDRAGSAAGAGRRRRERRVERVRAAAHGQSSASRAAHGSGRGRTAARARHRARWPKTSTRTATPSPRTAGAEKVGRNELCPCGSGRSLSAATAPPRSRPILSLSY